MSKSLYHIEQEFIELINSFDEAIENASPEEVDSLLEEMNEAMSIHGEAFEAKADAYCQIINEKKSRVDYIKSEIARLNKMKQFEERKISYLQDRLISGMETMGHKKCDLKHHRVFVRESKSVQVTDIRKVPKHYLNSEVKVTPDKKKLKEAINSGEKIDGAYIQTKRGLQIK